MAKRLVRPKEGRVLGGVCLALSQYFNIDVVFVRLIFALLLLPGGLPGFVPYLIGWIIIPSER